MSRLSRLTKKQMIEMVKCTGQYIMEHAEDIVGADYESLADIYISVTFESNMDELPNILVDRNILPSPYIRYVTSDQFVIDGRSDQEVKDDKT